MMQALLYIAVIIPCFAVLAWSADRFVYGAGGLARELGMAPLLVGLVIVGFGTSAPELMVSAAAALADNSGLAVGNAVGSNIANIALILGLSVLFIPLVIDNVTIRRELLAVLAATALVAVLMVTGHQNGLVGLSRLDGWLMLAGLALVMTWLVHGSLAEARRARQAGNPAAATISEDDVPPALPVGVAIAWLIGSLAALLISARLLVWAAVQLATAAGVSDLVIGLTIVAVGTSLPELATAVAAARQRQFGLLLGNILGSNLFNILGVLGLAMAINPALLPDAVLYRDYLFMALLTLLLAWLVGRRGQMGRWIAALMLLSYAGYQVLLFSHQFQSLVSP